MVLEYGEKNINVFIFKFINIIDRLCLIEWSPDGKLMLLGKNN
jgi:hypothetical protein